MWQSSGSLLPALRQFSSLQGPALTKAQHQSVIGTRDEQGHFLSQRTAEYPSTLASRYSNIVSPLFEGHRLHECSSFCALDFALQCIPRKDRTAPPFGAQDGGGIYSTPDCIGPGTTLICFLTCARSGNNGCWKSIFPQGSPSMWQPTVRSHFLQKKKRFGYNNLSSAFPTKHSTSQDWNPRGADTCSDPLRGGKAKSPSLSLSSSPSESPSPKRPLS